MSISIRSARSASVTSRRSARSNKAVPPPGPSLTPSHDSTFETCAASASFFLYAQRNVILCLHHDTLAIERRFERHREDVQLIAVDNVSDQGSGRLVVSYDSSQTTIVWDLLTGSEVARFASYEEIRVAVWMKNGNIAFGNSQGNVILFEPSTSEHLSARTIFDPITALAPSTDCRTFAIGYMNGSILIANLQPSFTILHTLSTNRPPSPLNKLAWHGSSSKQKSDMLAAQSVDGDLRVWSVPKAANGDSPSVIRVLSRSENDRISGANWFGWSKNGRIVQYTEGLTFVWDVRTKRVTYESVPTVDGLVGITNYGSTAALFTLGRNHTVQQYDLNPSARPMLVQNVQHVPAKLPPSPPISDGELGKNARYVTAAAPAFQPMPDPNANLPLYLEVSSSEGEEESIMSPLQRIAKDLDQMDEERDMVGPLSPVSSRSSLRSASSHGGGKRRRRPIFEDDQSDQLGKSDLSSNHSGSNATTISMGSSVQRGFPNRAMRESVSTRSLLSVSTSSSSASRPSRLREEVARSPEEARNTKAMDLFPFTRARLADLPFRPPQYDQNRRTPDDLRIQMLNVVFGWPDDIEGLVRDELSRHPAGSASGVMLSKWLGDLGADFAASMIGSESMTSSDWMLLALSNMGHDSQKKVGEAFVQRLLEKGDIHPAVAILLGLGEYDDAVEVYVSRKFYMEAVLLACLLFPSEWQRQSHLVRKWGEIAVASKQAELAVRCFSCTSIESSEPWFSPRAQDAIYTIQQNILAPDTPHSTNSPMSPPSATARRHPLMAGLKVVTNFSKPGDEPRSAMDNQTPMVYAETPIESAVTPGGPLRKNVFKADPSSAITATPGGYNGRRRFPSSTRTARGNDTSSNSNANFATPMTALKSSSRAPSEVTTSSYRGRSASASQAGSSMLSSDTYLPTTAVERGRSGLPSPAHGVFARLREEQHNRYASRERKPEGLSLHVEDIIIDPSLQSGVTNSEYTNITVGSPSVQGAAHQQGPSPPLTGNSLVNAKITRMDNYINGLDEANYYATEAPSRTGTADPERRPGSRATQRAASASRGPGGVRYVKPAKRSPSSPVSMSPDDPALQISNIAFDDERFYQRASTTAASTTSARHRDRSRGTNARGTSRARRAESTSGGQRARSRSRPANPSRQNSADDLQGASRGRDKYRGDEKSTRSPESPRPMSPAESTMSRSKVGQRVRERSMSRRPRSPGSVQGNVRRPSPDPSISSRKSARSHIPKLQTNLSETSVASVLRKRELAAQELEARRLSLARQPSAPPIIHPNNLIPKSAVEPSADWQFGIPSELELIRGHTADPHALRKLASTNTGTSSRSVPIGLPATPRAMRHPKYMGETDQINVPAVPEIPDNFSQHNQERSYNEPQPQDQQPALLPASTFTLLPATTFLPASTFSPARSASAPPEKFQGHQRRGSLLKPSHSRQNSGNEVTVVLPASSHGGAAMTRSIDEALHEQEEVIIVDNSPPGRMSPEPVILPELQHLSGPTPPPPPPPPPMMLPHHAGSTTSLGVINIGILEEEGSRQGTPAVEIMGPSPETTPAASSHRRGRGSVSENMGQKFRNVRDRVVRDRSASRNRVLTISPPVPAVPLEYAPAPYESKPPTHQARPYESNPQQAQRPYDRIPQAGPDRRGTQSTVHEHGQQQAQFAPTLLPSTTYGGYRTPKDIARQMTQDQVQFGAPDLPNRDMSQSVPPIPSRSNSVYQGYRSRELRANMPPGQLQFGVEKHPDDGGMI